MSQQNRRSLSLSINPYAMVRMMLADKTQRKQVAQAVKDGPATSLTEKLGYCNLAAEGEPDCWSTLFGATVKDKQPGDEGVLYAAKKTQWPIFRLREQIRKPQEAAPTVSEETGIETAGLDLDAVAAFLGVSKEKAAQALAAGVRPDTVRSEDEDLTAAVEEILNSDAE